MMRISLRDDGIVASLAVAAVLVGCKPAPESKPETATPTRTSGAATVATCEKPHTEGKCPEGDDVVCNIKVSVDAQGKITVDPYTLKLPAGANKKQTIVWELADATYVFTSVDGPLDIKRKNGTDAKKDHSNPGEHDGGKRFKIKFHPKHESQEWAYTMQVRKKETGKPDTTYQCDPYFNNQGT